MNTRETAESIFMAGVRRVLPGELITDLMTIKGSDLLIGDHRFPLNDFGNIFIIGAGKASAAMGHFVENILGNRITGGHIVVKYGHSCKLKKVTVTEAGHPIPDSNGLKATEDIIKIAAQAGANDLVICLISGGGSALLVDLPGDLLPEELYIVNNLLVRSRASINEINCVRKHLSKVKGGQLAGIVWPATLVTLILSDVNGNLPDVIGSGPTVPDPSTFKEALQIIENYRLTSDITSGVLRYLTDGIQGFYPETAKPGDPVFSKTFNILAGTNLTALKASEKAAVCLGFNTYIVDSQLKGDLETVAHSIVEKALQYKRDIQIKKPVCLLYGGETTIRVNGEGRGGRNQHLALSVAMKLKGIPGITFLSAGTDGTDGPTPAAGAVVDSGTLDSALHHKTDPVKYIKNFDSYSFFRIVGGQILTGPTYTNVMDIVVVLIS